MKDENSGFWTFLTTVFVVILVGGFATRLIREAKRTVKPAPIIVLQVPAVWTPARRADFERCVNALDPDAPDLAQRITDCAGVAP